MNKFKRGMWKNTPLSEGGGGGGGGILLTYSTVGKIWGDIE